MSAIRESGSYVRIFNQTVLKSSQSSVLVRTYSDTLVGSFGQSTIKKSMLKTLLLTSPKYDWQLRLEEMAVGDHFEGGS